VIIELNGLAIAGLFYTQDERYAAITWMWKSSDAQDQRSYGSS